MIALLNASCWDQQVAEHQKQIGRVMKPSPLLYRVSQ